MIKAYFKNTFATFFILAFLFVPFTSGGINYQYQVTEYLFSKPVIFIQDHFFKQSIKNIDFSSDTISLNILFLLLLLISAVIGIILNKSKNTTIKFIPVSKTISSYYIAFILLKYGIDKIFKKQFYLPEPNILYAQFGDLTKDTLYWSVMGLSYSYSICTGIFEVLITILILIKKTRVFGLCLAIAALVNIIIINFSFDISVKTFSIFLFLVSLFALSAYIKPLCDFFFAGKTISLNPATPVDFKTSRFKILQYLSVTGFIAYILFPYLSAASFNDDNADRPLLHGAYEIEDFVVNQDTLDKMNFPVKKVFIHRHNYIIFQLNDGKMIDYFFEIDPIKKQLTLQDYKKNNSIVFYDCGNKTGSLTLRFTTGKKWLMKLNKLDWRALPALQDKLHLTIDEIQ